MIGSPVGLNAPGGDRMLCKTGDAVVIKQRDDDNEAGLSRDGGHVVALRKAGAIPDPVKRRRIAA